MSEGALNEDGLAKEGFRTRRASVNTAAAYPGEPRSKPNSVRACQPWLKRIRRRGRLRAEARTITLKVPKVKEQKVVMMKARLKPGRIRDSPRLAD
jgi:hypothetical protein